MKTSILFLKSTSNEKTSLLGKKAVYLGSLFQYEFPVPDGFCVTTEVFREYIKPLEAHIRRLDIFEDEKSIRRISNEVMEQIQNLKISQETGMVIANTLHLMGEGAFILRSSVYAKGGEELSFQGVCGANADVKPDQLIQGIKDCWASLYTESAIIHRLRNGIKNEDVSMCVIVEKMVRTKNSGVLYTAHPKTNNQNQMLLYAYRGMQIRDKMQQMQKDEYVVQKHSLLPIHVNEAVAGQRILDDDGLSKLFGMGKDIEAEMKWAQRIEWCIDEAGSIYIVQAEPIPAWYPAPDMAKNPASIWLSLGHLLENACTISPMGQSLITHMLPFGFTKEKKIQKCNLVSNVGGRLYFNISSYLQSKKNREILLTQIEKREKMMTHQLMGLLLDAPIIDKKSLFEPDIILRQKSFVKKVKKAMKSKKNLDGRDRILAHTGAYYKVAKIAIESEFDIIKKTEQMKEQIAAITPYLLEHIFPIMAAASLCRGYIETRCKEHNVDERIIDSLYVGFSENPMKKMEAEISYLCSYFKKNQDHIYMLEYVNYEFFMKELKGKGRANIAQAVETFMDSYEFRGANDIDIGAERFHENMTFLLKAIKSRVVQEQEEQVPPFPLQHMQNENILAMMELKKSIPDKKTDDYIQIILNAACGEEMLYHFMMKIMQLAKEILVSAGKTLEKKGLIYDRMDIFYLEIDEAIASLKNGIDYKDAILQRKKEYALYKKMIPPRVIKGDGTRSDIQAFKDSSFGLQGVGVSKGVVSGRVRKIDQEEKIKIKKEEILVIPSLSAGYLPLLSNGAGVICLCGSAASFGAIFAKELGIPAVFCVDGCMEKLHTGDYVKIDGESGLVTILE